MDNALIIFVKNPQPGKVKTRLAKTVGDERALEVYNELMEITAREVSKVSNADCFVFYSNFLPEDDNIWKDEYVIKEIQEGEGLGERMNNAFSHLFEQGYKRVAIIGSDLPELTQELIEQAFSELEEVDVVLGPAKDGGYYLLAMKKLFPQLFEDKSWSTDAVFDDTIDDLISMNKIWHELPILNDIDTEEDLKMMDVKRMLRKATQKESLQL
jgi:rSAM/selenodomain-associated transferase 1